MKTFSSNNNSSRYEQQSNDASVTSPHNSAESSSSNARPSPVLSLETATKEEEENLDNQELRTYWTRKWAKWCLTKTKEEIDEAKNTRMMPMPKRLKDEAQETIKEGEEYIQEEQKDVPIDIPQGDVRAYFTRHQLSQVLVQPTAAEKQPTIKAMLVPGSNVMNEEISPPILEDSSSGPICIQELPRKRKKSTKRPANLVAKKKQSFSSRVMEEEEANPADTALFESTVSTAVAVPNKPRKRRRFTFKQKLPTGVKKPSVVTTTSKESAAADATLQTPKRRRLTLKQKSPLVENESVSTAPAVEKVWGISTANEKQISPLVATIEKETNNGKSDDQDPSCHAESTDKESESTKNKQQAVQQMPKTAGTTKPPFRHALLKNACMPCETTTDYYASQEFSHPQHSPDTQTDGVLSSIEMEYVWLCEESLHCLEGNDVCWSFIYEHASFALRAELRKGTNMVRSEVAERMSTKRDSIRAALTIQGYRRPEMKQTIALHRIALRQGIPVEKLRERMAPSKMVPKKQVASTVPAKPKPPAKKKPTIHRQQPSTSKSTVQAKANIKAILPNVGKSKILTKNESEIAWLLEESMMQNAREGIDYQYVLDNASAPLRTEMERHQRRWLPRLVRLNRCDVKREFEEERGRIYQLLFSGYRRPETKAALPAGRVTCSQYKEQQDARKV